MDLITQLARDLEEFAYDYDYYGYVDAFDDRQQAVEDLEKALFMVQQIDGLIEYLEEIVCEQDENWAPKAQALIDRVNSLYADI